MIHLAGLHRRRSGQHAGWLPLLVLFVGIDEELKYVCIAWSTAIPVTLAATRSIADVSPNLVELGRVFDFTPLQRVSAIVLPAALPSLFTGVREGLAAALAEPGDCRDVRVLRRARLSNDLGPPALPAGLVIAAMLVIGAIGLSLNAVLEWNTSSSRGRPRRAMAVDALRARPLRNAARHWRPFAAFGAVLLLWLASVRFG
ncbi:ABC transporter permease [Sinorhizobium meliloti]|uniref:ABC transporter permease n=1 Tax=Rhizobium meliloti TaxID=382 RepID=UPI000FDA4048|nr:ABC transporter permease subunit [Sinorhizobium meliloti]